MRRFHFLALAVFLVAGGTAGWLLTRPEPEAPKTEEKRLEDVSTEEYEKWMQDLGYSE